MMRKSISRRQGFGGTGTRQLRSTTNAFCSQDRGKVRESGQTQGQDQDQEERIGIEIGNKRALLCFFDVAKKEGWSGRGARLRAILILIIALFIYKPPFTLQQQSFIIFIHKMQTSNAQQSNKSTGIRKNSRENIVNEPGAGRYRTMDALGKGQETGRETDRSTGRPKQRGLYAESQLVADTSRFRLSTQELIPNFREKYETYELLQELADSKRSLQLKNKQIFYLSNQIVSLKDQYSQKIIQLESVITENKRELTELRYAGLKNKRLESQKGDRALDQFRKNYELQIHNIKEVQEALVKKLQQQHRREMDNVEQKLSSMLNFEKRERSSAQEIYDQKCKNYQTLIKQLQEQNARLHKERESECENNRQQQLSVDLLKKQFNSFSEKANGLERNMKIQIERLNSQMALLEEQNSALRREKQALTHETQLEISQLEQTAEMHKGQIAKLKQIITVKDKEIQKLIQINFKSNKLENKEKPIEPVRVCNHVGLIQQLQRNVAIKQKQNSELREQLGEWGKYIGFDRSCQERTIDLLNASSEALQTQQSFASSLRKKMAKFNS